MGRKRKSRREYGTGSILRNSKLNRYTVRWYDAQGKHKSCSVFPLTPEGKQQAEAYLQRVNTEIARPMSTLGDWIVAVLKHKKTSVRASSLRQLKYAALLVPDHLLEAEINDIKPYQIMCHYNDMVAQGRAISTVRLTHGILSEAYRLAKTNGAVDVNIMLDVTAPRSGQKNKVEVLSWRAPGQFFHRLRHRLYQQHTDYVLLFRVLYGLGCRIGELQALQWTDIDWQRREVHIQRTVSGANGREIAPPKTTAGDRYVPILSDRTYTMLRAAFETATNQAGYVFAARGSGKPLIYPTIHHVWHRYMEGKKIHCLRHTRASHLISAGFPIPEVSRILGHSSPAVTMEIYTHALPRGNERLLELYKNLLKRK